MLWPLLARRWFGGAHEPPEERNAHRCSASNGRSPRHREAGNSSSPSSI
jgi:hypothetical protein